MPRALTRIGFGALALIGTAVALSACGDSDNEAKGGSTLTISIADQGKAAKFTVPKKTKGGVTTLKFTNKSKAPHSAQLVLIKGKHTPQELSKAFSGDTTPDIEWARFVGGAPAAPPGQTATATVSLPAGHYFVVDVSQEEGPPVFAELDVTAGKGGSLPSTDTKITAAETGKDKWRWDISGPLKTGSQDVTFKSEGKEAIHFIGSAAIKGDVPDKKVLKAIGSDGPPPPFLDQKSFYVTAILDGGKSDVTQFTFAKPGRYVLFCPLTDRGEKEQHDKQGLVKVVTVK